MAGFVVCRNELVLFVDDAALLGPAPADLVARLLQIRHLDAFLVGHGREQGPLVDNGRQIRPTEHRRAARKPHQVHVAPELDLLGIDFQDLQAPLDVRQGHVHLTIKTPGPD